MELTRLQVHVHNGQKFWNVRLKNHVRVRVMNGRIIVLFGFGRRRRAKPFADADALRPTILRYTTRKQAEAIIADVKTVLAFLASPEAPDLATGTLPDMPGDTPL